MGEVAIECKKIKKGYGTGEARIEALRGIDLEIYAGQLTLIVGPSGSGKTTLLSIITSILTPDEGELLIFGHNINKMSENERAEFCRKNLGIVFQSLFLVPTLTVLENISLPLLVSGFSEQEADKKAMEVLNTMNLGNRANTSPSNLSRGQQQRIAIARAIVNGSKIIVCDEPTSALDHQAGMEIMSILQGLAGHSSRAVVVVTHDHRIFSFADRIVNMDDGKINVGNKHE